MNLESILKANPNLKLLSKAKLFTRLKDDGITKRDIEDYFNPRELTQIYQRPQNTKFKFKITAQPRSFQIDVAIMPLSSKRVNNNINQILMCIDIISRKSYCYPLKSGKMDDVLDAYQEFIGDVDENINSVSGDNFFASSIFESFNTELNIKVYTDVAKEDHITPMGNKLGIVDRFTRTLKGLIKKYSLENKTKKWVDALGEIVELYNDSPHSGLNDASPNEVYDDLDYSQKLYEAQFKKNQKMNDKVTMKVGDRVRVMLQKKTFEKEKATFSTEIYTIEEHRGYRFKLKGVKRLYRPSEMNIVTNVKDRLEPQTEDNQIRRMQRSKAFNSYDEIVTALDKKDEPKAKRTVRKPKRFAE